METTFAAYVELNDKIIVGIFIIVAEMKDNFDIYILFLLQHFSRFQNWWRRLIWICHVTTVVSSIYIALSLM